MLLRLCLHIAATFTQDSDTSAVMISLVHELPSKAVLEPPPEGFQYNSEYARMNIGRVSECTCMLTLVQMDMRAGMGVCVSVHA